MARKKQDVPDAEPPPQAADQELPRRTRSLAELADAAAAADGAVGVRCPKCWCRDTRVEYTYDVDGGRRRKRMCRNCGGEFATTEK
jgi:hypothetical protein